MGKRRRVLDRIHSVGARLLRPMIRFPLGIKQVAVDTIEKLGLDAGVRTLFDRCAANSPRPPSRIGGRDCGGGGSGVSLGRAGRS